MRAAQIHVVIREGREIVKRDLQEGRLVVSLQHPKEGNFSKVTQDTTLTTAIIVHILEQNLHFQEKVAGLITLKAGTG